ncbi:MAG TPA: AMP-binding protein, partial [Microthrixaceae bacterium]|nr:AMP-binding protein [Microthrixaceae bacterium]
MGDHIWTPGDPRTCNEVLDRRLDTDPDGDYLDVCGTRFSAAEVESVANRIANSYAGLGVSPGDPVATLIENSPEAMLVWWGAVRGNVVAVPINTAYKGDY